MTFLTTNWLQMPQLFAYQRQSAFQNVPSLVPAKISFSLKSFVKSVCWVLISRSDIFYLAGWEYRGFVVGPVTWSASGHVTSGGKTGRDQKFEALAIITSTWNSNFDRGPSINIERGYGWKDNCGSMCGSGFCADSGGQWLARDRPLTRVTRHYAHISPTWTFSDIGCHIFSEK